MNKKMMDPGIIETRNDAKLTPYGIRHTLRW